MRAGVIGRERDGSDTVKYWMYSDRPELRYGSAEVRELVAIGIAASVDID
jgi:hypothetical protein